MDKLRVLDLFSGIGGFSLGLERAGGFQTVAFCEIEEYPRKVLAKHWPGVPIYEDVRTLTADTLSRDGIAVDVICGGFPCQDISFAGRRAGLEGARSGLWVEYARLIGELRPRFVIVENVPGLLSLGMGTVLGDLAALGYNATWDCIPACAVGAPHRRDRVWIVGHTDKHSKPVSAVDAEASGMQDDVANARSVESGERYDANEKRGRQAEAKQTWMGGCEDVAHAGRSGLPHVQGGATGSKCGRDGAAFGGRQSDGRDHDWIVEPDVGRVAPRFSSELDRGLTNGKECKRSSESSTTRCECGGEDMRKVRLNASPTASSSRLQQTNGRDDTLSEMPRHSGSKSRCPQGETDEAMQGMRSDVHAESQQEAQHMQCGVSFGDWPHQCNEALGIWEVEPDVPRIATGVKNRVDRLKGLGNAVVPQIPELIGRAIMQAVTA